MASMSELMANQLARSGTPVVAQLARPVGWAHAPRPELVEPVALEGLVFADDEVVEQE